VTPHPAGKRLLVCRTRRGRERPFTMAEAWSIAMAPGGSMCVVDLDGGGYAVPVARGRVAPPVPRLPIAAFIRGPDGIPARAWITPPEHSTTWRISFN